MVIPYLLDTYEGINVIISENYDDTLHYICNHCVHIYSSSGDVVLGWFTLSTQTD